MRSLPQLPPGQLEEHVLEAAPADPQLLGQHALLAVRLTRSEAARSPELEQVVRSSLTANAGALEQVVGVTYDAAQAERFKQLWSGYTDELAAYGKAAAAGDGEAAQEARTALLKGCQDWGAWLAGAGGGRVPDPAVTPAPGAASCPGRAAGAPGPEAGAPGPEAGAPGPEPYQCHTDPAGTGSTSH
jgi:hypothetical protein